LHPKLNLMKILLLGMLFFLNYPNFSESASYNNQQYTDSHSMQWIPDSVTDGMGINIENDRIHLKFQLANNSSSFYINRCGSSLKTNRIPKKYYCWNLSMLYDFSPPNFV